MPLIDSVLLSDARILAAYSIFIGGSFPDPHAGWLTLAMASTLAGNLTITGSVANIIVVERAAAEGVEIGFRDYFRIGRPRHGCVARIRIRVGVAVSLVS